MAEFHTTKIPLWAKISALFFILACLGGALIFTSSLDQSGGSLYKPKKMTVKTTASPRSSLLATSYLEYLPVKAQSWALDKRGLTFAFSSLATILVGLFVLSLLVSFVQNWRRGQYDHELAIEKLYEQRFKELRSAFFRLIRKV